MALGKKYTLAPVMETSETVGSRCSVEGLGLSLLLPSCASVFLPVDVFLRQPLPVVAKAPWQLPLDIPHSCQEERPSFPVQVKPRMGSHWPGLVTHVSLKPRAGSDLLKRQGLRRGKGWEGSEENPRVGGQRRWAGAGQTPPQLPASPPPPAANGRDGVAPTKLV